jgi:hypothetical protein
MTVRNDEIKTLKRGVEEARAVKLNRLARLIEKIAALGELRRDGIDPIEILIGIDELVEYGCQVSRDLMREMPPAEPAA